MRLDETYVSLHHLSLSLNVLYPISLLLNLRTVHEDQRLALMNKFLVALRFEVSTGRDTGLRIKIRLCIRAMQLISTVRLLLPPTLAYPFAA